MELRQYWNVIWKRRRLVLGIIGLVAVLSAAMALTAKRSYEADIRLITRQDPTVDQSPQYFTFDRYYNWFSSEFLVDDYTQIVDSDAFANSTLQQLKDNISKGILATAEYGNLTQAAQDEVKKAVDKLKTKDMKDMIGADRRQRILRVYVNASPKALAKSVSDAAATVLADAKMQPIQGKKVDDRAVFEQIDVASINDIPSSASKEITSAVVRVILGIAAALALAFLLEYLDRSVRDERDASRVLEMPVLGAIPRV